MKRWIRRVMAGTGMALLFMFHFPQASPAPLHLPLLGSGLWPGKLSPLHLP